MTPPALTGADEAAAPAVDAQSRQFHEPRSLVILVVLGAAYTVFFASSFLLPVFLALLFAMLLHPFVERLRRRRVPEWAGAAIVITIPLLLITLGGYALYGSIESWIDRAPQLVPEIHTKLSDVRESVEKAEQVTKEIEKVASTSAQPQTTVAVGPSLVQRLLGGTRSFLIMILATVVLLYFLLARGRLTTLRALKSIKDRVRRRRWKLILGRTQRDIGSYLLTVTVINILLGLVTALVMAALGMPDALLWGTLAAILNFMPYIGSLIMAIILAVVSLSTFDGWLAIVLPPLAFLFLTALEGQFLTPAIVGRRLTLNPIAVFVSVLFWGWLWGMPGALLAVPLLALLRVLSDHIEPMAFLRPLLR